MVQATRHAGWTQQEAQRATSPALDEGWLTLLLHLVVIGITAAAVSHVDGRNQFSFLVPMAVGGLLVGVGLARVGVSDTLAHLVAFVAGALIAVGAGAVRADGFGATVTARGRNVIDIVDRLFTAFVIDQGAPVSSSDLAVLIGLTLWLVGYSSGWMLHRRHWLFPALLLPGVIALVGIRFDERTPSVMLAVFAAAALVMVARHHAFLRQAEWSRMRVPAPGGVATRFVASGALVAALALLLGWFLSYEAPERFTNGVLDRVDQGWEAGSDVLNRLGGPRGGSGLISGASADFSDSFAIGSEFNPSPDPVAALTALEPTYLAVRRYDFYDGHGWSSNVDATFRLADDSSDVPATSVTFAPGQPVPLTSETSQARENRAAVVTVFRSKDGLLFTTDTFLSASERSVAIIGWKRLPPGYTINVAAANLADVPVDLQGLVRALQNATVEPGANGGEPVIVDQELARQIDAERQRLRSYPVHVELSQGPNGELLLSADGRVPNYDDIEAVYSGSGASGLQRYRVTGSTSLADEEDLRGAGTIYPAWITARYLELPSTITERTRALAQQIVDDAGAANPFDQAWAIQEYLQTNYTYTLKTKAAPGDQDWVDFFLFDNPEGFCEHYASAMVVMARTLGIPARLVSGYSATTERDASGDYLYREEQRHTWVEVFFPGYGWIAFEPTQGRAPFSYTGEAEPRDELPAQPTAEPLEPTPTPESEVAAASTPETVAPVSATTGGGSSTGRTALGVVGVLLTAVIVLVVLGGVAAWMWTLRGMRPAASLFQRTIRIGRLWGIEPSSTMTPAEFAAEWGRTVPRAGGAVRLVTELYASERYGGVEMTEVVHQRGGAAWREVRAAVRRWRPWRRGPRS